MFWVGNLRFPTLLEASKARDSDRENAVTAEVQVHNKLRQTLDAGPLMLSYFPLFFTSLWHDLHDSRQVSGTTTYRRQVDRVEDNGLVVLLLEVALS